jgi:phage repressor protein C with HTH and peptisase S24 domain
MTHEPLNHPTWDGDALAEALGRTYARMNEEVWTDEAFLAWLAAEARARGGRRARAAYEAGAMLASGRALRIRVLARQSGVGLVPAAPRLTAALRVDAAQHVMEEARAVGAVPYLDLAAAAGAGRELWDEPIEEWLVPADGAPRLRAIAMRIRGESMEPLLHDGDTVLVELTPTLVRGRIVVARHPENGYVCKRVERIGRRDVLLASLNRACDDVTIPRDERLIVGTVRVVWTHREP